jgi:hypothetical protein
MLDHLFLWHDIVGNAGVALIVGCYFFIQVGRTAQKRGPDLFRR